MGPAGNPFPRPPELITSAGKPINKPLPSLPCSSADTDVLPSPHCPTQSPTCPLLAACLPAKPFTWQRITSFAALQCLHPTPANPRHALSKPHLCPDPKRLPSLHLRMPAAPLLHSRCPCPPHTMTGPSPSAYPCSSCHPLAVSLSHSCTGVHPPDLCRSAHSHRCPHTSQILCARQTLRDAAGS